MSPFAFHQRPFGNQRIHAVPLLSQVFQPARKKIVHAQAVLQHAARRRKRSKDLPQVTSRVAVQCFSQTGIGVHAQLRRRCTHAGMGVDEAVRQLQLQGIGMALLHLQMDIQP